MKRRVLVLMLGMIIFLCATLSGCLTSSKTKSLDKYWDARPYEEVKDESGKIIGGKVRIWDLTEEGKKQTFLVLPKEIAGYEVKRLEGPGSLIVNKPVYFGKVKGLVFEGNIYIYSPNTFTENVKFEWLYCSGKASMTIDMFASSSVKYPIIYPDSYDIHNKIKDKEGKIYTNYNSINFKSLSENIKEYKTEDGELWSKFTDETNLVFEEGLKLYNDELIIIASEEMESITFPESLKKINKLRIIPSEKQPEGTEIILNISSSTSMAKGSLYESADIVKLVRY